MRRRMGPGGPDLQELYRRLRARWGHQGWWPGQSPFEVCLGAILTQNTAWTNAFRALGNLRDAGLLEFAPLRAVPLERLAELIRPAGTFNLKARRLSAFLDFVEDELGGDVEAMAGWDPDELRARLLAVPGIGPETADSIVLYAAGLPSFVVDAYTRRILGRVGWLRGTESYDEVRQLFMSRLPRDAPLYNDYHAQLVRLAKEHCRARPLCEGCPVADRCAVGKTGMMKDCKETQG